MFLTTVGGGLGTATGAIAGVAGEPPMLG